MRSRLIVYLLAITFHLEAQTTPSLSLGSKISLDIKSGLNFPLNHFEKKIEPYWDTTQVNGFANRGIHAECDLIIPTDMLIKKRIRVCEKFLFGVNYNAYDSRSYDLQYSRPLPVNVSAKTAAGNHYNGQYMFGPDLRLVIGSAVVADAYVVLGVLHSIYPTVTTTYTDGPATWQDAFKPKPAFNFGYCTGATLYLPLNKVYLALDFAYSRSQLKYKGYTETRSGYSSSSYNGTFVVDASRKMTLEFITLSLGLGYYF